MPPGTLGLPGAATLALLLAAAHHSHAPQPFTFAGPFNATVDFDRELRTWDGFGVN